MKKEIFLTLALILSSHVSFTSLALATPPRYIYCGLGTLGGNVSNARSLNNTNRVVGQSKNASGDWRSYFKDPGQPMQDMFSFWYQILDGQAYDINSDGYVVGEFAKDDGINRAFCKTPGSGGAYYELDYLGGLGGTDSTAYAINSSKHIVGAALNSSGFYRAFRVIDPLDPTMEDLATLGGNESKAYDINDLGVVVGTAQNAEGNWLAFMKPATKTMISLGVLVDGTESCANAINNLGQVVGWAYDSNYDFRPFLKNPAESMQDLGTPSGAYGEARDINDVGQVVGSVNSGRWYAALWMNGSYYYLEDLTVNLPPNVELHEAEAINANGCIAGIAVIDLTHSEAFLLIPVHYIPLELLLD